MPFKSVMIATVVLCSALSVVLLCAPSVIFFLFQIEPHDSAVFIARRAAVMFFGMATMCFYARDIKDPVAQRAIALGYGAMMVGLAVLGGFELARGTAGPGILLAIAAELLFAALYLRLVRSQAAS
jgi:hypothetical protein